MKRPVRSLSKRQWWLLVGAGILVVALGAYAYYHQANHDRDRGGLVTPTPSRSATPPISAGDQAKIDAGERNSPMPKPSSSPSKSNPSTTPVASAPSVIITQAGQSGGVVQVRTVVSGATAGSCQLVATGPGNRIAKTAVIRFEPPSAYSCDGFDIPVSEFSVGGSWTLSLTATAGGHASTAFSQTVAVTK